MTIEMLDESNKDFIFSNIPKENKENKALMRIKSLRSKDTWYVLENNGNSIVCIVESDNTKPIKRKIYLWEFYQNDCYVDKIFRPTMDISDLLSKVQEV